MTGREVVGVFRLRYVHGPGTAFLHYTDNGCCLLTAAHLLSGAQIGDLVEIQRNGDWLSLPIIEIKFCEDGYDVCAFITGEISISQMQQPYPTPQLHLGQQVMFVGFPHDLVNTYPGQGYPSPFVKVAFFSGVVMIGNHSIIILDGINNPGYSGGAAFCQNDQGLLCLFGVISGYKTERPSHGRIYRKNEAGQEEWLPDVYTKPNSGMVQVVGVDRANIVANALSGSLPVSAQLS